MPQATLFVTHEMVLNSLRLQQYFDVKWVTEFAQKISHFVEIDSSESPIPTFPVELEADYSDDPPGVPNFKGGVETLWQSLSIAYHPHDNGEPWILPFSRATHIYHQKPEKVGLLAHVLFTFVTGEICQYWSNSYPEELELAQVFSKASKDENGRPILPEGIDRAKMFRGVKFLLEPETVGYEVARWLRIADEVELLFKR
ncbi:MAG: hypothetical protein ABI947_06160 [Chloroflexota bacterium]